MVPSNEKIKEYMSRLLFSRMRILYNNSFYGLLLMHMVFSLDVSCETVATDGKRVFLNPLFIDELSDSELDFVLMHEILHVVLQHCLRQGDRDKDRFSLACDIVVNSSILLSENMNHKAITLQKYGEAIHTAPNGKEGYEFSAEQIYSMLPSPPISKSHSSSDGNGNPCESDDDANEAGERSQISKPEGNEQPKKQKEQRKQEQQQEKRKEEQGKQQEEQRKQEQLQEKRKEEQQKQEQQQEKRKEEQGKQQEEQREQQWQSQDQKRWDNHSRWGTREDNDMLSDIWQKHFEDACEAITSRDPSNQRGLLPLFAARLFAKLKKPQLNWKALLNDFIQEEICDFSFAPPDRRFDDNPFFLPAFNEKEDMVEDILFMIDTSGSMSDDMITTAYSEIKGAIDQFDGRLKGWLGFFDAAVVEPKPFTSEEEFKVIKPVGGGGTSFKIIFEYVYEQMQERQPASIIILTDGYAPFPDEKLAKGIPVLWLLNNEEVNPPWGKIARVSYEENAP